MRNLLTSMVGGACLLSGLALSASASAMPIVVSPAADYSSTPFTFGFMDAVFTLTGTGDIFNPTAISTGGTGKVNTIFGSPTTNFVNRGTVTFGPNDQYGAFADPTTIRFSNGDNFIGLMATGALGTFYGYAFTTNAMLNSFAFESVPGRAITATTAAAVPEAGSLSIMAAGVGIVGFATRRRRRTAALAA